MGLHKMNNQPFNMVDGYYVQNNDWHWEKLRPKSYLWGGKIPKTNVMEIEAKKKRWVPGPNKYDFKTEWGGQYPSGGGHSGKCPTAPKITYIDAILATKELKLPGPGQYKPETFKIPACPIELSVKGQFIDNCRWYG